MERDEYEPKINQCTALTPCVYQEHVSITCKSSDNILVMWRFYFRILVNILSPSIKTNTTIKNRDSSFLCK